MYCLLELLAVVCLVALVATILFVVGAGVILVDGGMHSVLRLWAKCLRQIATFSTATPMGQKMSSVICSVPIVSKIGNP
jgi:hypothetical protein